MCGRFTYKLTWEELVKLYRLTLDRPPHNLQPRYNVCPTDPIDVVTNPFNCDLDGRHIQSHSSPSYHVFRSEEVRAVRDTRCPSSR